MKYIFGCKKCNKQFTIEMPMSEYTDNHKCPDCNEKLEREISNIGSMAIWKCAGAYSNHSI